MNHHILHREIREKSEVTFSHSGGPGGQNVNKRNTKVTLRLPVGSLESPGDEGRQRIRARLASRLTTDDALVIHSELTRNQWRNREEALRRMESLITEALRPPSPPRKATRPSRAARERRLAGKKHRSSLKASRRKPAGSHWED